MMVPAKNPGVALVNTTSIVAGVFSVAAFEFFSLAFVASLSSDCCSSPSAFRSWYNAADRISVLARAVRKSCGDRSVGANAAACTTLGFWVHPRLM